MIVIKNHKAEIVYFSSKQNIYFCETTEERVKIIDLFSSGLVNVINKRGFKYQVLIQEVKKIY